MEKLNKIVGRGVLALAFGAFVLSFEKLHHVALSAGIHPKLAWIYPLIVEGFTTIATLAAFLKRGTREARYPWFVGVVAFGFSLWANSSPESVPDGVVRAVPVLAIPLAVHMFIIISAAVEQSAVVVEQLEDEQYDDEPEQVAPVVELGPRVNRAANNLLAMARAAATPELREFWERKAAEAVAA